MLRYAHLSTLFIITTKQSAESIVIECRQVKNGFCERLTLSRNKLQHGNTDILDETEINTR